MSRLRADAGTAVAGPLFENSTTRTIEQCNSYFWETPKTRKHLLWDASANALSPIERAAGHQAEHPVSLYWTGAPLGEGA